MREILIANLMCLLILAPIQSIAAPACEPPAAWPLGDHRGEFAQAGTGVFQTQGGWDPSYFSKHQGLKDALTEDIQTYHVGLPESSSVSGLKPWHGSCNWSQASLNAAGMPTISLLDETGGTINQVYLVAGYNMRGCTVLLQTGVKVAVWGSAFKDIRTSGPSGGVWIVDSLIDADTSKKGPFRGGEQNSTCRTHVMYSEQLGGLDVGKTHNMTYYRNHLHGSMKVDGGHADGLQINSSSQCAFIFENNVDFLFRMTNRAIFLANSNPGGIRNTWVVNNLVSGGANTIAMCLKTADNAPRFGVCEDSIVCGNRTLADNGNVSWASPGNDESSQGPMRLMLGDGIVGDHYRENNGFYDGRQHRTTVRDNEGDSHSLSNGQVVPASSKASINSRVSILETWTSQIRAGAGGGETTPVPPPAPGSLSPPVLLE